MPDIDLLIIDPNVDDRVSDQTRFGGTPSVQAGFVWPVCKVCSGNMQFLGQVRRTQPERLLSLFMCQNKPGLCDEWDADRGGNALVCTGVNDLALATLPETGDVSRPERHGAVQFTVQSANYDLARIDWAKTEQRRQRDVLGQIGGKPVWIQGAETPTCDHCRKPMRFAAQLEEGPHVSTAMNFGSGGCAYVFECTCAGGVGKLLWQC